MMFEKVISDLNKAGVSSYLQGPGQLVVCTTIPNFPTSNSFWVTCRDGVWFISTWLPAIYRIPLTQQIADVCVAVLKSSQTAAYRISDECIRKFALEELNEREAETFLEAMSKDS